MGILGEAGMPLLPQWERPFQPFKSIRVVMYNTSQTIVQAHFSATKARTRAVRSAYSGPPTGPVGPWVGRPPSPGPPTIHGPVVYGGPGSITGLLFDVVIYRWQACPGSYVFS